MYHNHVNRESSHCCYTLNHHGFQSNQVPVASQQHAASYHVHQQASPPLQMQEEIGWYNQETPYYQQQQIFGDDFDVLFSTFGPKELSTPQELALFNLLQDQQQEQQPIQRHENQLIQNSSLNEWALVNTNFHPNNPQFNINNTMLPLSPMSMQSADNFDASPIAGGTSFSRCMYSQTNSSIAGNSTLLEKPNYHQQPIVNRNHPKVHASESSIKNQEIAQTQYQYQQVIYASSNKPQQQQPKRITRRRASRSQLECKTCFKTFSRPYNLKSHQRTHTKERPFECLYPECGWTFARPHDLKRHQLLHSGVKPFECVCGKRFARSDAYKRHQSVDINCAISTLSQEPRRRKRNSGNNKSNNSSISYEEHH